ncbi:MAG: methyltransferase [Candidatus Micrarchaeaceae archaeon]
MEGIRIDACDGVYYPREDSYLLAEAVEKYAFGNVLDMGTGTGIQGITAAKLGCKVVFADLQEKALECARHNAAINGVSGEFVRSNLFSAIGSKFDTIIFNPPYLPSEEVEDSAADPSLDGGKDGRVFIDAFLASFRGFLNPGGLALLVESSLNGYEKDIVQEDAELVGKAHYSFEDIAVLLLGKSRA